MNGAVLKYVFQTNVYTKNWYGGFSSPDLPLPRVKKYPTLFVLNTDVTTGPGEHWCLILLLSKKHNEFFDPYGNSPTLYNFDKSIFDSVDDVIYNDTCVQGLAPTCGHHCIFFGIHRAIGYPMEHIVKKLYSQNLCKNDNMVFNFVKDTYGESFAKFIV